MVPMKYVWGVLKPAALREYLLSRGRLVITTDEVADLLGIDRGMVRIYLSRRKDEFISPARGLWVAIPPEYSTWGAPEALEFIDEMMRHLGSDYYVGWLSAAALHGSSHQSPMTFQVATSKKVGDRRAGRNRMEFLRRSQVGKVPTVTVQRRYGEAKVSSPEATALSVAADPLLSGGIGNVATVIHGLAENGLDAHELRDIAHLFPGSASRRVGWIIETFAEEDMSTLLPLVLQVSATPSKVDPHGPWKGETDHRWKLKINDDIESEW